MSEFSTQDFYLAAFLVHSKIPLTHADYDNARKQTIFYFNDTDELRAFLDTYFSLQGSVEPIQFGQTIRVLKTIIHSKQPAKTND